MRLILILILLLAGPAICVASSDDPVIDSLYQLGKSLYYDGEYEAAKKELLTALEQKQASGERDDQLLSIYVRLGKNARRLRTLDKAQMHLDAGLALAEEIHGVYSEEVADCLFELGSLYGQKYDPVRANEFHQRCVGIYERLHGKESSQVGNMLMNLGINSVQMANYQDAERYFLQTFAIFEKTSDPESQNFNRIYSNMGYLYRKMGNYEKAIEYGNKALRIKLLHYRPDHPSVAKYHRNIARAYEDMGAPTEAIPYMLKSIEILEATLGTDHATTGGSYGELGNMYAALGQYDKALDLYQRANSILQKTLDPTHPYLVGGYFNVGRVYEDQEKYELALNYYDQVLIRFSEASYVPENLIAQTKKRIAILYFKNGQFQRAMETLQEALGKVAPGFTGEAWSDNPSIDQVQNRMDFLELLRVKGKILDDQYLQTKEVQFLEDAYATNQHALQLVEALRRSYFSEEAMQSLNERTADILDRSIRQAFDLQNLKGGSYWEEAFRLAESSKARILWEALNGAYALETAGIPTELTDSLNALKVTMGDLEEKLLEQNTPEVYTQWVEQKIQYEQLVTSIEQFNPDYYRLKYGVEPLEIGALQKQIPTPSTRLVEYYLDSLNLYIFVIDQGKLSAWQLPYAKEIETLVRAVRSEHEAVLAGQTGDPEEYALQLARLYEILIKPWANTIESDASWVIIPHGVLHYLSFETLLPEAQSSWRQAPFLLHQVDIQYAWSADFWGRPPASKHRSAEGFLGFAPTFGTAEDQVALRANFAPLPNAVGEVQHAADLFAGELFQGFLASESNYYAYAKGASIIHLATHSVADDAFPMQSGFWLSMDNDTLEDGFLNALEIYNYPLQADLVVLSACNTGYGKLAKGEGVMSLGRAFSYAGSESLLMSLWVANDLATSTILNGFYEGLAAGNPKQVALQKAKRDYLTQADPLTAHPAYWSHLIFLGNPQPLSTPWSMMNWLMIGGLGLVLGIVLLFWFRGGKT